MSLVFDHNKGCHDWYRICARIRELYPDHVIFSIVWADDTQGYEVFTNQSPSFFVFPRELASVE